MPIVGLAGETEASIRNRAKETVRKVKRQLHIVDTRLEILERRLDKILERKTLVQVSTFDSYLKQHDAFITEVRQYVSVLENVLMIFSTVY